MMASVLHSPTHHPLQRFLTDQIYESYSPFADDLPPGDLPRSCPRSISAASILSAASLPTTSQLYGKENTPPRLGSRSALNLVQDCNTNVNGTGLVASSPRQPSWRTESTIPSPLGPPSSQLSIESRPNRQDGIVQHTSQFPELRPDISQQASPKIVADNLRQNMPTLCVEGNRIRIQPGDDDDKARTATGAPMSRFLDRVRRRNARTYPIATEQSGPGLEMEDVHQDFINNVVQTDGVTQNGHRKSLSITSSLGFVNAVTSASITLASTSIAPRSRRSTKTSNKNSDKRNSKYSDQRQSLDSNAPSLGLIVDEKVAARSLRRRKILEEIISSEECYVSDLKVLFNVCATAVGNLASANLQRCISLCSQVHHILLLVASPFKERSNRFFSCMRTCSTSS